MSEIAFNISFNRIWAGTSKYAASTNAIRQCHHSLTFRRGGAQVEQRLRVRLRHSSHNGRNPGYGAFLNFDQLEQDIVVVVVLTRILSKDASQKTPGNPTVDASLFGEIPRMETSLFIASAPTHLARSIGESYLSPALSPR